MFNEKCNCGLPAKYSHGGVSGKGSCNKRSVCPTYEELFEERARLRVKKDRYEIALKKIVRVNAMDYEYKSWADTALCNK